MRHLRCAATLFLHVLLLAGCGRAKPDAEALLGPRKWVEQPFINSLGMKFVPVIVDEQKHYGPRYALLVCIHPTRKMDYRKYAESRAEANGEWRSPTWEDVPVSTGEDHPVVNVDWLDAQAFCAWLSAREKLPYRLPTDHEWSCAVGIGDREDPHAAPFDKSWQIKGVYPWGTTWPPPEKAANLLDAAYYRTFSDVANPGGPDDGFATTSPVMSFKPNALGLYDLAGNVCQWCEDWTNHKHEGRVTRGSSWLSSDQEDMESAVRPGRLPSAREAELGFRVVLQVEDLNTLKP